MDLAETWPEFPGETIKWTLLKHLTFDASHIRQTLGAAESDPLRKISASNAHETNNTLRTFKLRTFHYDVEGFECANVCKFDVHRESAYNWGALLESARYEFRDIQSFVKPSDRRFVWKWKKLGKIKDAKVSQKSACDGG